MKYLTLILLTISFWSCNEYDVSPEIKFADVTINAVLTKTGITTQSMTKASFNYKFDNLISGYNIKVECAAYGYSKTHYVENIYSALYFKPLTISMPIGTNKVTVTPLNEDEECEKYWTLKAAWDYSGVSSEAEAAKKLESTLTTYGFEIRHTYLPHIETVNVPASGTSFAFNLKPKNSRINLGVRQPFSTVLKVKLVVGTKEYPLEKISGNQTFFATLDTELSGSTNCSVKFYSRSGFSSAYRLKYTKTFTIDRGEMKTLFYSYKQAL